jgi:hypothetical protein
MNRQGKWRELCIAAAFEDSPDKLTELVREINTQLTERQEQLTDRIFERLAEDRLPNPDPKHWIQ